jgi:hypothetical protein
MMRLMHVVYEGDGLDAEPTMGWRERAVLIWGKLRRFYLLTLRRSYVKESLKRRVGECRRSGACCKLAFPCPWFSWLRSLPVCRYYTRRPRNCTVFPIDERDIRDRDIVNPYEPCGFTFLSLEEARKRSEKQKQIELIPQR